MLAACGLTEKSSYENKDQAGVECPTCHCFGADLSPHLWTTTCPPDQIRSPVDLRSGTGSRGLPVSHNNLRVPMRVGGVVPGGTAVDGG